MNEYVALYKSSVQITEDSYKVIKNALKLTDDTTIGQIKQWAKHEMFGGITIVELTVAANAAAEKP